MCEKLKRLEKDCPKINNIFANVDEGLSSWVLFLILFVSFSFILSHRRPFHHSFPFYGLRFFFHHSHQMHLFNFMPRFPSSNGFLSFWYEWGKTMIIFRCLFKNLSHSVVKENKAKCNFDEKWLRKVDIRQATASQWLTFVNME